MTICYMMARRDPEWPDGIRDLPITVEFTEKEVESLNLIGLIAEVSYSEEENTASVTFRYMQDEKNEKDEAVNEN